MPMSRAILTGLVCLLFATGCATVRLTEDEAHRRSAALADALRCLSPQVDGVEADRAADAAVRYPLELAHAYHATPPAFFNNVLINVGLHPRGLCFQWADDLTAKLMTLHLRTLELHRGVARLGTKREHSCVVLTAPAQPFAEGIALDAWRRCGRLKWATVAADKYPWQEVVLVPAYKEELRAAAAKLEAKQTRAEP
jgi:hypothetical protein